MNCVRDPFLVVRACVNCALAATSAAAIAGLSRGQHSQIQRSNVSMTVHMRIVGARTPHSLLLFHPKGEDP